MTAEPQPSLPCDFERFIPLERCPNFRDFGGYMTGDGRSIRRGQLYRSMSPEYMTEGDLEVARGLGIRLVIDLRGWRARSSGPLAEAPVRRLRVGHPRMLATSRAALLEYAHLKPEEALPVVLLRLGRAYAKAASAIANEPGPSLVHCRLGKDRTGVFAAVLLKTLGVSDEDVMDDYMLSGLCLDACHEILAEVEAPTSGAMQSRVAREAPNRAAMLEVLRQLNDHYGGGESYLRFHGMRKRDVLALRERLLE
jgi:protein-tyrosine phosphatase